VQNEEKALLSRSVEDKMTRVSEEHAVNESISFENTHLSKLIEDLRGELIQKEEVITSIKQDKDLKMEELTQLTTSMQGQVRQLEKDLQEKSEELLYRMQDIEQQDELFLKQENELKDMGLLRKENETLRKDNETLRKR